MKILNIHRLILSLSAILVFVFIQSGFLVSASAGASESEPVADRCGPQSPCQIKGHTESDYVLSFPENWDGKKPLIPFVFFHGHGGAAQQIARGGGLVKRLKNTDYLLIVPNGPFFNFNDRRVRGWAARKIRREERLLHPGLANRREIALTEAVLRQVKDMVPLKSEKLVISGFSSGGSMAWYFACYSKQPVDAVIAIAGGLRRPLPQGLVMNQGQLWRTCPVGPRKLLHIHGFSDSQVPLEGRGIRAWHQGDVHEGLSVMRKTNSCQSKPATVNTRSPLWCRTWNDCTSGKPLRFCLHSGGHGIPKGWLKETFNWIEQNGS